MIVLCYVLHHKTIIFYLLPVDWLHSSLLDSNKLIKIYDMLYSSSSLLNAVLRHKKSFVLKDDGGNSKTHHKSLVL